MAGMQDKEVYLLYPPPQLHIGILGPGNDAIKSIEKYVALTDFKRKHNLKGHGPGGDLNGQQLKDLMSNKNSQLDGLKSLVRETNTDLCLFVDHMRHLSKLNKLVNSKELDMNRVTNVIQALRIFFSIYKRYLMCHNNLNFT